jgi:hypothetical protein
LALLSGLDQGEQQAARPLATVRTEAREEPVPALGQGAGQPVEGLIVFRPQESVAMPVTRLPEEAQEVRHQGQGRALAHGVLDGARQKSVVAGEHPGIGRQGEQLFELVDDQQQTGVVRKGDLEQIAQIGGLAVGSAQGLQSLEEGRWDLPVGKRPLQCRGPGPPGAARRGAGP